jgi:hypothetical protein
MRRIVAQLPGTPAEAVDDPLLTDLGSLTAAEREARMRVSDGRYLGGRGMGGGGAGGPVWRFD